MKKWGNASVMERGPAARWRYVAIGGTSPAPAGRQKVAQYVRRRRASSRGGVGKCWVVMAKIQFRSAEGQCAA